MPSDPTLALILDRFLERLDEVVERSTSAIAETIPSYAKKGDGFMSEVAGAVRANVSILAQVLNKGREVTRTELDPIESVGRRRAEEGIPLEDVLHAYRTVSRVCWTVLAEECRNSDADALEATILLAEAVLRYTDQISTAVADAYARSQRAIVREQEGARREFLADLLYGTDVSPDEMLRRAHTFGYDLSLHYVALVGQGPAAGSQEASLAAAVAKVTNDRSADPIVLQKADHSIALIPLLPADDEFVLGEKLVTELDGRWRFGVGGPELGLEGIRRAYLQAREALEIGVALDAPGPVFRFDDLLPYHFLRIEPALAERFVDLTLGPLIEYDRRRKGELIPTLEAYFGSGGSVKRAGELLFAHPHTVSYRLRQVERLTGWSLREAEDRLRLQLALRAHRLARSRGETDDLAT